jgi:hypothetical protein
MVTAFQTDHERFFHNEVISNASEKRLKEWSLIWQDADTVLDTFKNNTGIHRNLKSMLLQCSTGTAFYTLQIDMKKKHKRNIIAALETLCNYCKKKITVLELNFSTIPHFASQNWMRIRIRRKSGKTHRTKIRPFSFLLVSSSPSK